MTSTTDIDHTMMHRALRLAQAAARAGEAPVGAVVGDAGNGEVFGQAHNESVVSCDPTAHAEVLALRRAGQRLGNYRLSGLTLWTTLEPCAMCAGAISHARLEAVVFAAPDPKTGAVANGIRLFAAPSCIHKPLWRQGPLSGESSEVLRSFFAARR